MDELLDLVPPEYMTPEGKDDFLNWLAAQPLPPEDKKQILLWWCDYVKLPITEDMVIRGGARY